MGKAGRGGREDEDPVTLGDFTCNLSRNFVAPLRDRMQEKLASVTGP